MLRIAQRCAESKGVRDDAYCDPPANRPAAALRGGRTSGAGLAGDQAEPERVPVPGLAESGRDAEPARPGAAPCLPRRELSRAAHRIGRSSRLASLDVSVRQRFERADHARVSHVCGRRGHGGAARPDIRPVRGRCRAARCGCAQDAVRRRLSLRSGGARDRPASGDRAGQPERPDRPLRGSGADRIAAQARRRTCRRRRSLCGFRPAGHVGDSADRAVRPSDRAAHVFQGVRA